jgi:hypothetical protein
MDIKTELSRIVENYGGVQKKKLMLELELLINDIIESQKQIQIKQKNNVSIYANVERLIQNLIHGEWYPISTIPDNLMIDFFNIADMNHKIVFDADRGDQYFKITRNDKLE